MYGLVCAHEAPGCVFRFEDMIYTSIYSYTAQVDFCQSELQGIFQMFRTMNITGILMQVLELDK